MALLLTTHAGHAVDLAAEIDPESCSLVVSVGGDGTLHEVINGLAYGSLLRHPASNNDSPARSTLPPLAIVPCGSGNTAAFSFGITNVEDALGEKNVLELACRQTLPPSGMRLICVQRP